MAGRGSAGPVSRSLPRGRHHGPGITPGGMELGLGEEQRVGEIGSTQIHAPEIGPEQVGTAKISAPKVGADEAGPT